MKVIAKRDLANYLTAGKEYEVEHSSESDSKTNYYNVVTDDGETRIVDANFFLQLSKY